MKCFDHCERILASDRGIGVEMVEQHASVTWQPERAAVRRRDTTRLDDTGHHLDGNSHLALEGLLDELARHPHLVKTTKLRRESIGHVREFPVPRPDAVAISRLVLQIIVRDE